MRTEYACIGGHIDIEGLSLVRFDLKDTHFKVLRSYTIPQMPTYDETLDRIVELADIRTEIEVESIDLLTNFTTSLKNFVLNKNTSDHKIRIRTTQIDEQMEDMILNLFNLIMQNRIAVEASEQNVQNSLSQLTKLDKRKLKDIYEGNETLNQVLYAVLHSVSWLEAQMIRHRMI